MYIFFKKIVKKILPQKFLYKIEPSLRKAYSFFYKGNKFQCCVCDSSFNSFISLKNGELICPRCGSLPRNRRLYDLLIKENLLKGKILDFSPSRALYRQIEKHPGIEYLASDFAGEFISDYQFDITSINLPDEYADLIICYHILEHVPDDRKAMAELYRVLKTGGTILLQTPFRDGEIFEDASITTTDEREKYFGQKDHVRIYSVEGLSARLEKAGFSVKVFQFDEKPNNSSGFNEREIVILAKK